MITWLAGIVVLATAGYLLWLAAIIVFAPALAEQFLASFASSARTHYVEQGLRLVAGLAYILFAPQMRFSTIFLGFGWLLVATTVGLLLIPWRWHHRYGQWAIPLTLKYIKLYALGAVLLSGFILFSVVSSLF